MLEDFEFFRVLHGRFGARIGCWSEPWDEDWGFPGLGLEWAGFRVEFRALTVWSRGGWRFSGAYCGDRAGQ